MGIEKHLAAKSPFRDAVNVDMRNETICTAPELERRRVSTSRRFSTRPYLETNASLRDSSNPKARILLDALQLLQNPLAYFSPLPEHSRVLGSLTRSKAGNP